MSTPDPSLAPPPDRRSPRLSGAERSTSEVEAPRYRVSVAEEAFIVERGERRRKWFVRHRQEWVRVGDHPSAVLEAVDDDSTRCPPGIVWQRRFELVLERGARLMAVSTFPRLRARSTLWYLNHGLSKTELVYQQRQYVVAGNYRLVERGKMQQHVEQRSETRRASPA